MDKWDLECNNLKDNNKVNNKWNNKALKAIYNNLINNNSNNNRECHNNNNNPIKCNNKECHNNNNLIWWTRINNYHLMVHNKTYNKDKTCKSQITHTMLKDKDQEKW